VRSAGSVPAMQSELRCRSREQSRALVAGVPGPPPAALRAIFITMDEELVLFEVPRSRPLPDPRLPTVEAEVLALVLAGRSNAEIARIRRRSPRTIANEVARLFRRLGVRSRLELFALAAAVPRT